MTERMKADIVSTLSISDYQFPHRISDGLIVRMDHQYTLIPISSGAVSTNWGPNVSLGPHNFAASDSVSNILISASGASGASAGKNIAAPSGPDLYGSANVCIGHNVATDGKFTTVMGHTNTIMDNSRECSIYGGVNNTIGPGDGNQNYGASILGSVGCTIGENGDKIQNSSIIGSRNCKVESQFTTILGGWGSTTEDGIGSITVPNCIGTTIIGGGWKLSQDSGYPFDAARVVGNNYGSTLVGCPGSEIQAGDTGCFDSIIAGGHGHLMISDVGNGSSYSVIIGGRGAQIKNSLASVIIGGEGGGDGNAFGSRAKITDSDGAVVLGGKMSPTFIEGAPGSVVLGGQGCRAENGENQVVSGFFGIGALGCSTNVGSSTLNVLGDSNSVKWVGSGYGNSDSGQYVSGVAAIPSNTYSLANMDQYLLNSVTRNLGVFVGTIDFLVTRMSDKARTLWQCDIQADFSVGVIAFSRQDWRIPGGSGEYDESPAGAILDEAGFGPPSCPDSVASGESRLYAELTVPNTDTAKVMAVYAGMVQCFS